MWSGPGAAANQQPVTFSFHHVNKPPCFVKLPQDQKSRCARSRRGVPRSSLPGEGRSASNVRSGAPWPWLVSSRSGFAGTKRGIFSSTPGRHFLLQTAAFRRWRRTGWAMGETPVAVFLCDAPNRAGRSPAAISPLSLRPHLTRKMAFEQRAIFPQLTGVSSRFSPANGARWWSPAAAERGSQSETRRRLTAEWVPTVSVFV